MNYVELVYFIIGSEAILASVLILVSWLFLLFISLGVTADDFLCPSLLVISETLGLSQNIAGVTFLAFGNGAPDIFSSLAGIKKARAELVIGELFGAGIFVTTVVAGSILLNHDFKLMERPLLRDIGFYMLATYLTWFVFYNGVIKVHHAMAFIGLYFLYIIIVIFGRVINKRNRNTLPLDHKRDITIDNESESEKFPILSSQQRRKDRHSSTYSSISTLLAVSYFTQNDIYLEFFMHICPIDLEEWPQKSCLTKFFEILKAPIYFLLTITIPVVDKENRKNNWCRILNALHCITGPFCILLLTGNLFQMVYKVPLVFIVLFVSIMIALIVILTSEYSKPPLYHSFFGYLGFAVSVVWIYALAEEVVDLLQAIGVLFKLSDMILGLTILAWGNSIGDLVSNISIARHGFPRMGLSACFGGPLMNLLMGIGLPYTFILHQKGGSLTLEYSNMVSLLYFTITSSLISTLLIILFTGFTSKKFHGLFLISFYFVYLFIASLIEFNII